MLLVAICLVAFRCCGPAHGYDVTRDHSGDVFRLRECGGNVSIAGGCDGAGAKGVPGRPCHCQCAPTHLAFREDRQQCVKEIRECYMSVFYRPFSVEAIPLVYLPTSGQLVHPDAHLSLAGRKNVEAGFPVCKAAVSQYLTQDGWRTLIRQDNGGGPVFGLYSDTNKTFLQFLGSSQDRRTLQQHLVLVRLFCKINGYSPFETCVAIRIGWVPGIDTLDDEEIGGGGKANMMVVGLSLGILCMVYVFAVLVYLKIRRQMLAKQKAANPDLEAKLPKDDVQKVSSLGRSDLSKRIEMYHVSSMGRRGSMVGAASWPKPGSLIVETYNRTWTDRMGQHGCEFRAQDLKLQPEFLDPEFMASPPQQVLEYLERLQNSVTFARHRLRSCYRYQPTLNGIPEDDYFYQELKTKEAAAEAAASKEHRTTPDGGSASSSSSSNSFSEEDRLKNRKLPSAPPKKPKRKSCVEGCGGHLGSASDQEQKDIQRAMNALNDTLDALELDICQQDLEEHVDRSQKSRADTSVDDFDSSSCSSLSAVTVLARESRHQEDKKSLCSKSIEQNQSEEFSTFSNSTYAVGLFHDGNKIQRQSKRESRGESPSCDSVRKPPNGKCAERLVRTHLENWCSIRGRNHQPPTTPCHDKSTTAEAIQDSLEMPPRLRRAPSSESLTTIATEMTSDSLESRASSPDRPSPTPSLMEMWISRLVQKGSVPYARTRRKSKKKLVLPDSDSGTWEHVCKKHACSPLQNVHDEQNLIDKLSSKTSCDVAGYFQSLKQDVLRDHLRGWLGSGKSHIHHKADSVKKSCSRDRLVADDDIQNGAWEATKQNGTVPSGFERSDIVKEDSVASDPIYESIKSNTPEIGAVSS